MLIAEIGDGHAVDQMAPQDGDLLNRRIVLAGLSHGETPAEFYSNSGGAFHHFRLKRNRSRLNSSIAPCIHRRATIGASASETQNPRNCVNLRLDFHT